MSNFKKLVEARMAETNESWQAASAHVRAQVLREETEALKDPTKRRKDSPIRNHPFGTFLGPRPIESGQTVELVHALKDVDWPWTPRHLYFPQSLRQQGLMIVSMTVGRRDQILGGPVPLDVFADGQDAPVGMRLSDDMVTLEDPLKIEIKHEGKKSLMLVGFVTGTLHVADSRDATEELAQMWGNDTDTAMLSFEEVILAPGETKTARLSENPHAFASHLRLADGMEYSIGRAIVSARDGDVLVDIIVDDESQTGGFVESARIGQDAPVLEFNLDMKPALQFTKKFVKDKTDVKLVVRNTSDRPRSLQASLLIGRALTVEELEERRRQPFMGIGPFGPTGGTNSTHEHEERFPWNIDAERAQVDVAPGETQVLNCQAQIVFKGQRLVVDEECRTHFEVVDVKTGREPSPLFKKPIAAKHFDAKNTLELGLGPVTPGIYIRLFVKNLTDKPQKFGATLKGVAIR